MPHVGMDGSVKSISVNTTASNTWTTPLEWSGPGGNAAHPLLLRTAAYSRMYAESLWVRRSVDKLTSLHVRNPLKVYRSTAAGREEASTTRYAQLLACPSPQIACFDFWRWMASHYHIYGISFARKIRDRDGRVVELWPLHPSRMRYGVRGGGMARDDDGLDALDSDNGWWFKRPDGLEVELNRRNLLIFKRFNPDNVHTGLSPLESLRQTLEADHANRVSTSAKWRNGGRAKMALVYKSNFGDAPGPAQRLRDQFHAIHAGPENHGKIPVLEDGVEPVKLPTEDGLEYIDERRLNAVEVAAAYDLPPHAIGVQADATYNNAAEHNRMLGRDTLPPIVGYFESEIELQLRDGRMGASGNPEFPSSLSAEWDLDMLTRGTYEDRIRANATAIQTGQRTAAEVREQDSMPFIEGSDELFVNAAVVPMRVAAGQVESAASGSGVPLDGSPPILSEGVPPVQANERPALPAGDPAPQAENMRGLWGYLGRVEQLDEIDVGELAVKTPVPARPVVGGALLIAQQQEMSVEQFRQVLKGLAANGRLPG